MCTALLPSMNEFETCVRPRRVRARALCFKVGATASFCLGRNSSIVASSGWCCVGSLGSQRFLQSCCAGVQTLQSLPVLPHKCHTKRHQPQDFPTFSLLEPNFSSSTRHRLLLGPPLKSFCLFSHAFCTTQRHTRHGMSSMDLLGMRQTTRASAAPSLLEPSSVGESLSLMNH